MNVAKQISPQSIIVRAIMDKTPYLVRKIRLAEDFSYRCYVGTGCGSAPVMKAGLPGGPIAYAVLSSDFGRCQIVQLHCVIWIKRNKRDVVGNRFANRCGFERDRTRRFRVLDLHRAQYVRCDGRVILSDFKIESRGPVQIKPCSRASCDLIGVSAQRIDSLTFSFADRLANKRRAWCKKARGVEVNLAHFDFFILRMHRNGDADMRKQWASTQQ